MTQPTRASLVSAETLAAVAGTFIDNLAAYVGAAGMAEIAQRNAEEPNPMVCHTHDFADANVFMDAAFEAHQVSSATRLDYWDGAWTIARTQIADRFLATPSDIEDQDDTPRMRL